MLGNIPAFQNDNGTLNDGEYWVPNDQTSISFGGLNSAFSGLNTSGGGGLSFCDVGVDAGYKSVILSS
jgi:hypothetical protein